MEQSTAASHLLVFRESTPERYEAMTADERRAALDRWNGWCDDLVARGKLLGGNTLAPEGHLVSAARATRPVDGPFAEAKELIGGYFLLSAASTEEATAIARECPNLPFGMEVEIRPIAQACHLARSLGWETMRGPAVA
ncbi:MAG TPA: YciI family protein [Longimicrobiaceae bacterium]|nr:YciI family protein [Longimicrobiaceae bacterium]